MLKKLSRRFKYSIVFLEILLVLLVFALVYNFFLPLGTGNRLVYFDEKNSTKVLEALKRSGYNITDWDHILLPESALPDQGWYRIGHSDEGRYHFFRHLNESPAKTMNIRVFPGETHAEMLHRLARDMRLDEKKLQSLYDSRAHYKEADILAGNYTIARKADENATLVHLFSRSDAIFTAFEKQNFIHHPDDDTLKLLLTVASIVQKESNDPKEMPLIASVIYNRLERGMKLQMDGTLNYGVFSHCIVTPERIKNDMSFYNTYKYKGLPPAPLATVSLAALKAAMFPAKSEYLFFMLNKDGSHNFSKTYAEHLEHLRAFREYQKEHQKCEEKNRVPEDGKKRKKGLKESSPKS
jgi:UPF0755 protein